MSRWNLTCLICGATDDGLVSLQEHAMEKHGYTQEDHRNATKREVDHPGHYIFTMPDGKDWMDAQRAGGNFSENL